MNFLVVKHAAQKVWVWCKNHTGLLLAATWAFILFFVFKRGNADTIQSVLEIRKDSHKKEVEAIKEAHEKEVKIRKENLETFHKTVSKIEKEYEKDQKERMERKQERNRNGK